MIGKFSRLLLNLETKYCKRPRSTINFRVHQGLLISVAIAVWQCAIEDGDGCGESKENPQKAGGRLFVVYTVFFIFSGRYLAEALLSLVKPTVISLFLDIDSTEETKTSATGKSPVAEVCDPSVEFEKVRVCSAPQRAELQHWRPIENRHT